MQMRPKERRETGEQDLFRSGLDQIIDMEHASVKLARSIDWRFLEEGFGGFYTDTPGQPPLPTRLMAGLAILKHMHVQRILVREKFSQFLVQFDYAVGVVVGR